MIDAGDKNVNVFHKGWQRIPSNSDKNPETGFEDPTYLGFKLKFSRFSYPNYENRLNDNSLFTPKEEETEGAERYLESIGMDKRAAMIKNFTKTMIALTERTPWYIQSVEGVAALWKIDKSEDGFDPYRGKELELTFNCLESIDLRMTAVADLYRKASFDAKYMREILPENLREFRCELQIAEFRKFHTLINRVSKISTVQNSENANNSQVHDDSSGGHDDNLSFLDNYISVISFDLRDCEFDFEDSFPEDTFSLSGDYTMAKQKFKIKVGKVYKERNQYTLLETILADDYNSGESSIVRGEVKTGQIDESKLNDDEKASQFLSYNKVDQNAPSTKKLDSNKKSELQRRLERGLQTVENRGRDEISRLTQEAKNLVNAKVFDNKIADFIRGFLDQIRAGELGESFKGNPEIKYEAVTGTTFQNPEIEYPGTAGTVFDPGEPTYPGTTGTVHDKNEPTYPGTTGTVFDPGEPTYPGTSGSAFEGNPDIEYKGVKDKAFENPEIEYKGVKDKTFENPAPEYANGSQGSTFENPEIKYSQGDQGSTFKNKEAEYTKGDQGSTFKNPVPKYTTEDQGKVYDGNPDIKYEKPDGSKILDNKNKPVNTTALEKVFDLTGMTPAQVQKLEKAFDTKQAQKKTEDLGDIFDVTSQKAPEKPEGKIFGEPKQENNSQQLGNIFPKPKNEE